MKRIIIAIPKSASTSLMHTIARLSERKGRQVFTKHKDLMKPTEYKLLAERHSDIREYEDFDYLEDKNYIFKQHVPPTENNILKLRGIKKVILLRSVDEVIEGIWRSVKSRGLPLTQSLKEWKKTAYRLGLDKELTSFRNGWLKEYENDKDNSYLCSFKYLIKNQAFEINEIQKFFNLPITNTPVLEKYRYTR